MNLERTQIWTSRALGLSMFLVMIAHSPVTQAQNSCDPGESPDVIVGDLPNVIRWGSVGDITAFSVATTSCNVGTCELNWISNNNQHPVIGASLYRLRDGEFDQLGQSWLKHGFFALSQDLCSEECIGTSGSTLGVNCSDPYSAGLNGSQGGLGPKFEVNASTGEYPYPATNLSNTGNAIYKRLQVHNDDLDPAKNVGARYWVDGHYVTFDDAQADKNNNNVSYREVIVTGSNGNWNLQTIGSTQRQRGAIWAWRQAEGILLKSIIVPGDGQITLGSRAWDIGSGWWHYEFAIENMNSDRSVGSFTVPLPYGVNLRNIGFNDVDYHSGEPYDGTDWQAVVANNTITWSTELFDDNPNANAVRWGTTYSFRFEADFPPVSSDSWMDLFKPGTPDSISLRAVVPTICDNDGVCDFGENCTLCPNDCEDQGGGGGCCGDDVCDSGENSCSCYADCGPSPTTEFTCNDGFDDDCDGNTDCSDSDCCGDGACAGTDNDNDSFEQCDCDDGNASVWSPPSEVDNLTMDHDMFTGTTTLSWSPPVNPGGDSVVYETVRSINPINFNSSTVCLPSTPATSTIDLDTPPLDQVYYYLIRADNDCPVGGGGDLGLTSQSLIRTAINCP